MKTRLTRFQMPPETQNSGILERFPVHVLLENIRSLYNVGSIFRSADAARIGAIHLCGITGRPPRKEIAKTALGAQDTVPWDYSESASTLIPTLKSRGFRIVAVEQTDSSVGLWEAHLNFPVCLVFGYEIHGISEETLSMCDLAVEIPMYGFKGSLNVAVACGIVMFETIRLLTIASSSSSINR